MKYFHHTLNTYLTPRENCPSLLFLPLLIVIITRIIVLVIIILALSHSDQVLFILVRGGPSPWSLETEEGVSVVMETGESLDQGLLHQGPDTGTAQHHWTDNWWEDFKENFKNKWRHFYFSYQSQLSDTLIHIDQRTNSLL